MDEIVSTHSFQDHVIIFTKYGKIYQLRYDYVKNKYQISFIQELDVSTLG